MHHKCYYVCRYNERKNVLECDAQDQDVDLSIIIPSHSKHCHNNNKYVCTHFPSSSSSFKYFYLYIIYFLFWCMIQAMRFYDMSFFRLLWLFLLLSFTLSRFCIRCNEIRLILKCTVRAAMWMNAYEKELRNYQQKY